MMPKSGARLVNCPDSVDHPVKLSELAGPRSDLGIHFTTARKHLSLFLPRKCQRHCDQGFLL